ncbi:MAG: dihydrofolate reductase [Treponema sp.]|nr:dihydrofolate reductase [Treponema sp.]
MIKNIIIIAAMSENWVIGNNNTLPWSIKADLARFRELTLGWPCIMGRKTWESLPKRPLPGRPNIVVSRTLHSGEWGKSEPGVTVFPSLQEAIQHCAQYEKIFICGGASIYREALPLAHTIELTVIHRQYEGDTFFPEINPALWEKTAATDFDDFSFISYTRV